MGEREALPLGEDAMTYQYSAEIAVQTLSLILEELGVDRIHVVKAQKLLYLVEREALKQGRSPITGDSPVAMKHGPVLSATYDLMKTAADWPEPTVEEELWNRHFVRQHNDLVRVERPELDCLSQNVRNIVATVLKKYGHLDEWALRDLTHSFPEWQKNQQDNTSVPIPLKDILEAVGRPDNLASYEQEAREDHFVSALFGS